MLAQTILIFYLGESLGGAVALNLAVESPPHGLILQSTFTGVRHAARHHYPLIPSALIPTPTRACDRSQGYARRCSFSTAIVTRSSRSRTARRCSTPPTYRSACASSPISGTTISSSERGSNTHKRSPTGRRASTSDAPLHLRIPTPGPTQHRPDSRDRHAPTSTPPRPTTH